MHISLLIVVLSKRFLIQYIHEKNQKKIKLLIYNKLYIFYFWNNFFIISGFPPSFAEHKNLGELVVAKTKDEAN